MAAMVGLEKGKHCAGGQARSEPPRWEAGYVIHFEGGNCSRAVVMQVFVVEFLDVDDRWRGNEIDKRGHANTVGSC